VEREKGIVKSEKFLAVQATRGRAATATESWHLQENWLVRNEQQNKSYAYDHEVPRSKKAQLRYRVLTQGDNYDLVEVELLTGRHHQIRCQLSTIGRPIKGDLKYGAKRSNPDGSISLQSHRIEFVHPVSKETICIEAPIPNDPLWQALGKGKGNSEK
jgi:23S rRNA pseudouridine1911/1915/1917 synthase